MATYYHPAAKPSDPGGNQDVRGAGYNGIRLATYDVEFTTSQLATGDKIILDRFSSDTRVIAGWIEFDELDSHATTPTLDIDVGWDDGTTDDPDAFLNTGVITGGGPATYVFTTGIGTAVTTFVPAADWDFELNVVAGAATAAAGGIKVSVLLADGASSNAAAVSA